MNYRLSPAVSIQPELLIAVKGTNQGGLISFLDWSFNYIELPVLVKYKFATKRKLQPSFYAGPSLSYLISSDFYI